MLDRLLELGLERTGRTAVAGAVPARRGEAGGSPSAAAEG
jgi:hypothetical protein